MSSRSTCYDASKARSELGWTHRPFRETARRLAALCCVLLLMTGCTRPGDRPRQADPERPTFIATFHAVATIVQAVAGERANVITLLEPGVSPHAYEPRPSDLRRLSGATATIFAAEGLDSWMLGLGVPAPFDLLGHVPDSLSVDVSGSRDPHFWLSPVAVASAVPALAQHLCTVDPVGCDEYQLRAASFSASLLDLDARLAARFAPIRREPVVVASSFLSYFLVRYGPTAIGLVELVEGVEPSPAHLQVITGQALAARAVVGQPWLPESAARAVAEAAEIPYVAVDPLGNPSAAPTYEALLLIVADTLERASRGS